MTIGDQIRNLHARVELLAPAGRRAALQAVLEAGADAVYLGTRQFNMRRHRADFNFTDDQLAEAVALTHAMRRRVYVTLNAMIGETELHEVRDLLRRLADMKVDAVIVQDLAMIQLVRELGVDISLHASTMMNVHHAEHARALKAAGVVRIIASRDISLQAIGEIGRSADIEVECFVHGDMCVCQSGQCSMSGVLFGKSANRGECMKPCRWFYELVNTDSGEASARIEEGHLLAIRDLCLVQNIPDIIQAGISSMKIEGRMRDPEYLGRLVNLYRKAIDQYYASPSSFQLRIESAEELYQLRVRRQSTLTLLGGSSYRDCFDITGKREPLFLSDGCIEPAADDQSLPADCLSHLSRNAARTELAVCVADPASARAAMDAGARRIYWAAEVSRLGSEGDRDAELAEVAAEAAKRGITVGLRTPQVTTDREWVATQQLLRRFDNLDFILVHHLGTLRKAAEMCPHSRIVADFGFNVLNSVSAAFLKDQGANQAGLSIEAGYQELIELAAATPLQLELLAHGPVSGMLIDHCLIALHGMPEGRKDVCRGPCRHVGFALRDRVGALRPIIADQYCRNHLLTAHDVGILPYLPQFLLPSVRSIRIEAQFYSPRLAGLITDAYSRRLAGLASGDGMAGWQDMWSQVLRESPRPVNLGAYARSIIRSRPTAQVMKECHSA